MINRKLRMGMIGGGPGAFIGGVHRIAAGMDGEIELVCGAFSSDPEKSKQAGERLNISTQRIYGSYKEMIRSESSLPPNERMEIVSIVTPNHVHFEPTKLALENGFHVILDKPLAFDLKEAKILQELAALRRENKQIKYLRPDAKSQEQCRLPQSPRLRRQGCRSSHRAAWWPPPGHAGCG